MAISGRSDRIEEILRLVYNMQSCRIISSRTFVMHKYPPALTKLLRPGVHIAQFLSREGNLVLLAISKNSYLAGAAEPTHLKSVLDAEGFRAGTSAWILAPEPLQDNQLPFLNPGNAGPGVRALRRTLLLRGVHPAPWRICILNGNQICTCGQLLAIDGRHRLVATMPVLEEVDPLEVRTALQAVLDSIDGTTEEKDE